MYYNEFDPIIIDDPDALEVIAQAEAILKYKFQTKPDRFLSAAGRLGLMACRELGCLYWVIPGYGRGRN